MSYCPKCGSEVEESDTFCSSCGEKLERVEKEVPKSGLLEELPSFHSAFNSGIVVGLIFMVGIFGLFAYETLMKVFENLKAEFGPVEVGLATPDIGWMLYVGILMLVIGIAGFVGGYLYYKSEYEKLERHMEK